MLWPDLKQSRPAWQTVDETFQLSRKQVAVLHSLAKSDTLDCLRSPDLDMLLLSGTLG